MASDGRCEDGLCALSSRYLMAWGNGFENVGHGKRFTEKIERDRAWYRGLEKLS